MTTDELYKRLRNLKQDDRAEALRIYDEALGSGIADRVLALRLSRITGDDSVIKACAEIYAKYAASKS